MKLYEICGEKKYSFSCIYCWVNLLNGKRYIGQAQNFYVRMTRYKGGNYNPHMKAAIEKYGIDNFDITIVEKDVLLDKLDEREQYWMDYYESYNPDKGYNICSIASSCRGVPAWNKGIQMPDETKEKISDGLKRYYSEHEVWNKGIPQTEEAKEKNRLSNLGENNGMYGRKHSIESKEKNRKAHLGKRASKEARLKMSKPIKCVETNKEYMSAVEAAKELGYTQEAMWNALNGKSKTCRGCHWVYIS